MKEVVIKIEGKEQIIIIVVDAELKLAKKLGLSERQYIDAKVKITLDEELKEKNNA
jgi:hypothetical protein